MQNTEIQVTQQHCVYCFQVLEAALEKRELPTFPKELQEVDAPLFVTFHIHGEELRGCIGTFSPGPISKQLSRFTLQSAFKDSRFNPIMKDELQFLDVGVSLLVNFQKGKKWDQWEVGLNGIIIDFSDSKGEKYEATFLPEVASEQEWDKITTLKNLIRKAGYKKNYESILDSIQLTTYESSKEKLTYLKYKEQLEIMSQSITQQKSNKINQKITHQNINNFEKQDQQ